MKKNLTLLLLCCAYVLSAQTFVPTTTLMPWNATWKWKNNSTDLGTAWYAPAYNDAAFGSGPAPLGYGSVDAGYFGLIIPAQPVATSIGSSGAAGGTNTATFYFRSTFTISTTSYSVVQFKLRADDGCAIYLNGQMISIAMTKYATASTTNSTVATSTVALPFQLTSPWTYTSMTNAQTTDGQDMFTFTLSVTNTLLVNGTNTIAVEAHNRSNDSSDILWAMQVEGGNMGTAPPAAPAIVKGPYLQVGTKNSMVIRWETDLASDSKVMYGTSTVALSSVMSSTDQVTAHEIKLTGLTPYTKYFYNIGSSSALLQGDTNNYFLTSPVPGAEGKYRFWVIGDCGNASTNQVNVKNQFKSYNGNRMTDGWLTLGDNAYSNGSDPQFNAEFFSIYQNDVMKNKVLWPVPGNHDYNNGAVTSSTTPYFSIFNVPTAAEAGGVASGTKAYYSYDYGNIHFIALDSYGTVSGNKMYDTLGAQAVWLKADLAANTKKWVIAYWHHPPYTMGSHNSDTESDLVAIRQKFIRILERYKVDLILCGHSHDYERSKLMQGHYGNAATFNAATHNLSQSTGLYDGSANSCPYTKDSVVNKSGTVYVLSGSAGQLGGTQAGTFPHDAMFYSDATNGGSLILDIEGNRLDAKWLCADGVVRDKFTMYKDVNTIKSFTVQPTETKTLQASWPGAYTWKDGTTTKTISVSSSSDAVIWVKDPNSCVADTFKLKVLPAVNFNLPATNCANAAVTFTDMSTNNTTAWAWSVSPSASVTISSATAKNPVFTFANTGTYTVSLISDNAYGSGIVSTQTISILARPNVLATLSSSAICVNQSATLTAGGAVSYSWSSGSTSSLVSVTPTMNTTYTLTGTGANGCESTSIKTLVVNSLPTVAVVSSPTSAIACQGESLNLSGSGASNYNWSGSVVNGNSFTLSTTTSFTVTGTDNNGCQGTAVKIFTINARPTLSINTLPASANVCNGSTLALTASGATTYTWSGTITNGVSFIPSASALYTVIGTDNNGCKNTLTQSVTVNAMPLVSISGNTTTCAGRPTTLTASGAASYLWSTAAAGSVIAINPSSNVTYTVTGTNPGGCQDTKTIAINVNPLPAVTISGNMSVCAGETATVTAAGATTYSWSNGNSTAILVMAPLSGYNYMVTGTDLNGCKNSTSTTFSVNALPVLLASTTRSLICMGETAVLSVSGATNYIWNTTASGSTLSIAPVLTTTYSVSGSNTTNTCSGSTSIVQNVSECTGLEKTALGKNTLIYPNPNKGAFNIELDMQGNFTADIYNALGERVYSAKLQDGTNNIRLNEKKGIYFYIILDASKVIETGKIILE